MDVPSRLPKQLTGDEPRPAGKQALRIAAQERRLAPDFLFKQLVNI